MRLNRREKLRSLLGIILTLLGHNTKTEGVVLGVSCTDNSNCTVSYAFCDSICKCISGYEAVGSSFCIGRTCRAVDIQHAFRDSNVATYDYSSYVRYSCNVGYQHTGGYLSRQCIDTNTWSGTAPTCSRITCAAVNAAHSSKNPDETNYDYNTYVTYTCSQGYQHTDGQLTRTCTAINTWSGIEPICTRITCAAEEVNFATRAPEQFTYEYNTGVTYTCITGYEHIYGSLTRTCAAINSWTGTKPSCTIKKCTAQDVPNSYRSPYQPTTYDYNTSVRYTCNNGYSHTDGGLIRTCKADKTWSGTEPTCRKIKLGESGCATVNAVLNSCEDDNANCRDSDNRCVCKDGYYDDNGNNTPEGSCRSRIGIDAVCQTSVSVTNDQCKDQNAKCNSSSICSCNGGYHAEGTGTNKFCASNKPLGSNCNQGSTGECSDPNARCLPSGSDYICTCNIGYYDDTGFNPGGNCQNMNNLMVSAITFSNVHTEHFTVSWTGPSDLTHVSSYTVSWTPGSGQTISRDKNTPTADITGFEPGGMYTVTVTTVNRMTQVSSLRTVSTDKEQSTKPVTPGPINDTASELNATDNTIQLVWASSPGRVSRYRVAVYDGDVQKDFKSVSSSMATISFGDMKNGYRYTVSIIAESMQYDGGKTVDSDTYSGQIKTVVMLPTVPRKFNCRESKDIYITLVWEDPEYPNGDLLQYTIDVYLITDLNSINKKVWTGTPVNEFKVQELEPGTYYQFRIYALNEKFTSEVYAMTACKTSDRVSDSPNDVIVSAITSRSMVVSWKKPTNSYGEILGYVLQLHDDSGDCIREIITKCIDCLGELNSTNVLSDCSSSITSPLPKTKISAEQQDSQHVENLLPYSNYSVSVAAVNVKGKGHLAETIEATLEEAPAKPENVSVKDITTKSFMVTWTKGPVRPGRTSYDINIETTEPAASQLKTVIGYDQESYIVADLEEFWVYRVMVTAYTEVASKVSDILGNIKTLPAAPGPVDDFKIVLNYDGYFKLIQLRWKLPVILNRNSIIQSFSLGDKSSLQNNFELKTYGVNTNPDYNYTEVRTVIPDEQYTYQICAVNSLKQNGECTTKTIEAPGGLPPNFEKLFDMAIIRATASTDSALGENTFPVEVVVDFFTQNQNGRIRDSGLLGCEINMCGDKGSSIDSSDEFLSLDTWSAAKETGFTTYRITRKDWLHEPASTNESGVAIIRFVVGIESCLSASDVFCNGALDPGKQYMIRAVACTSGGCIQSRQYGPFSTKSRVDTETADKSDHTVVIVLAVCLSLLAIGFSVLAGYIICKRRALNFKPTSSHYEVPLHNIQPETSIDEYDEIDTLSLDYKALTVSSKKLGSGKFGEVWKGNIIKNNRNIPVAVKVVKDTNDVYAISDLQKELETLKRAGSHPNVVLLHGYCNHNDCLYIVMEYMPGGDLRSYLHKSRQLLLQHYTNKVEKNVISQTHILLFALDVANGMAHLASRQIIHRDLAARNILLDASNYAKVSDFGLARTDEVYFKSSKTKIPVKWMAIESLLENKYTTKSDIWSFGVVLWEMTTVGGIPYLGLKGHDLADQLRAGQRLPRPENCSKEMYDIMWRCWEEDPDSRPTFQELSTEFQFMLDDSKVYMNLELNNDDKSIYEDVTV